MAAVEERKTSEARRRANDKWDKENMTTMSCRVRKDTAKAFKELCASRGSNASRELIAFIKGELAAAQQAHPVGDCAERPGAGEVLE